MPPADNAGSAHDANDASAAKRELRSRIRAARRERLRSPGAAAARVAAAGRLRAALLAQPAAQVGCVAVFEPLPGEPPVDAAAAALLERGVRVLVPHLRDDLDLDWRVLPPDPHDRDSLAASSVLLGRDAIADAHLVIVPALAVDHTGARLGQGGGSYDRALPRRSPHAVVVAAVHDDEFLDEAIPSEAHDTRMDAVLTSSDGWTNLPAGPRT